MVKTSILIALLPHLCCTMVLHNTIPCSRYFTYLTDLETTDILGQIEIPSPAVNEEFYLRVVINAEVSLDQMPSLKRFARLELARSIEESVQGVQQGRPLLYYIYFPSHLNPTFSAIWFNNQKYCTASGGNKTAIELGHVVYPPNGEPLSQNFQPWHRNSSSYFNPGHSIQEYNTNNNSNNNNNNNNINNNGECGIPVDYYTDSTNSLIRNGDYTFPGQWPWHVSISFYKSREHVYFQCSGTILTNRHIITAASGLKDSYNNNEIIPYFELKVNFGQLSFHGREIVYRDVVSYKIHPDYTHTNNCDSDLAVLTINTPVEFNSFNRPICLWSGLTNFEGIINRTGYIVGWENGRFFPEEPRMARVSIVSQEDCYTNDPKFIQITSNRTFCADLLGLKNLCYVDKGSGLVLFDNSTGRYQLRGIVSQRKGYQCNPWSYMVYVDVAKYIPWIRQQIYTT